MIDKDGSVPEMQCKGTEIQTELASLVGWAGFFTEFAGMFYLCSKIWISGIYL